MREIRTSGLMSGEGKRNDANAVQTTAPFLDSTARYHVERFPLGQLLVEPCLDLGANVILGTRRPVAPDPFVLSSLPGFQDPYDALFVNHREKLFAHLAGLGLAFDFIAADHAAAIGIGAGAVTARHRSVRLLFGGVDNIERADAAFRSRPGTEIGHQLDAGPIGRQTPVRRQRHKAIAIRAGDRACPEVAVWPGVVFRFIRERFGKAFADSRSELVSKCFNCLLNVYTVFGRPINCRVLNQRCDRIQVIGVRRKPQTERLERY